MPHVIQMCHVIIHHLSDAVCTAESHPIAHYVRTPFGYPCNIKVMYRVKNSAVNNALVCEMVDTVHV